MLSPGTPVALTPWRSLPPVSQWPCCRGRQRLTRSFFLPALPVQERWFILAFVNYSQTSLCPFHAEPVQRHLGTWFPQLPSYGGYVQRLNRVAGVFAPLLELLQQACPHTGVLEPIRLMDSLPIKLAHAKRSSRARVAPDIANKGYCSSKDEYYYGVKLHILGLRRPGTLPLPEYIGLTSASEHDLAAFRQIAPQLHGGELYLDKAYIDEWLRQRSQTEQDLTLWTPVKKAKGQPYLDPFDQWLSTAVSRVRQPIESLFNWLEEKTGIQRASKVRSYNGLLVHVFGRLAAAMWLLLAKAQSA